jgi:hypothetical protein
MLLSGRFIEIGMTHNTFDHGVFWNWHNERSILVMETDDFLMGAPTDHPFNFLQHELEKLFAITSRHGNLLK